MQVTLIITVHNRLPMLENILLSVANQSQRVDRIILADDGSTEDIARAASEWAEKLNIPVTHVRQSYQGFRVARSRNNAIREAEEGYLIFADQDLLFTRDYIATFSQYMELGRFLVAYPLRLDEAQTKCINEEMISSCEFSSLATDAQLTIIAKQYRKDNFYQWLHRLHLRKIGPKLRSGVFGAFKSDLVKVNGFDEKYQGWGKEDDDLGWRLQAAGITGRNVFNKDYALHQYHEPFHVPGVKVNKDYFETRKKAAVKGDFLCKNGLALTTKHHADVEVISYIA